MVVICTWCNLFFLLQDQTIPFFWSSDPLSCVYENHMEKSIFIITWVGFGCPLSEILSKYFTLFFIIFITLLCFQVIIITKENLSLRFRPMGLELLFTRFCCTFRPSACMSFLMSDSMPFYDVYLFLLLIFFHNSWIALLRFNKIKLIEKKIQ